MTEGETGLATGNGTMIETETRTGTETEGATAIDAIDKGTETSIVGDVQSVRMIVTGEAKVAVEALLEMRLTFRNIFETR